MVQVAGQIELSLTEDGRDEVVLSNTVPMIRGRHAHEWALIARELTRMGRGSVVARRVVQLMEQGKMELAAMAIAALTEVMPLREVAQKQPALILLLHLLCRAA